MLVTVIAQPRAQFDAWLHGQSATTASTGSHGEQIFLQQACSNCHQIHGTSANGHVGPDLTHIASRTTLAAGTIPNDRAHLLAWIRDPQHDKPGAKMPQLPLSDADLNALVDYLEGLK